MTTVVQSRSRVRAPRTAAWLPVVALPATIACLSFLVQALGLFIERSEFGRSLGLGRGIRGWLFCALVTVGPVGLLFHRAFVERIVIPMLAAFGLM